MNRLDFKMTAYGDFANGSLNIETNVGGQLSREALSFKDKAVREMLIQLGWTPPGGVTAERLGKAIDAK